jgi:hypothetical protein
MQLTREEAISCLVEEESVVRHGYTSYEIFQMDQDGLCALLNKIFEPIDEDDPYTVEHFALIIH